MSERNFRMKEFYNRNRNLWQFVLLLVVLVAVTITLVVTCLYQFIHRSDYEISLYQGLISSEQNPARTSGTQTAGSSTSKLTGKQAKAFDFEVSDDENVWGTDTSIELFHASYKNSKGEVTVQSADSKSVVAPGTDGSYTFLLKNASKLNSNYKVWLEADVNVTSSGIPLEFRISGSNGWIDGSGKWLSAEELNKVTERRNLYSGKSTEYTLYWRWPFERNEDEEDTSYGNFLINQGNMSTGDLSVSQSVSYKVTLHTLAAEGLIGENNVELPTNTPKPATVTSAQDKNRNTDTVQNDNSGTASDTKRATSKDTSAVSKKATKTGDSTQVWNWILLLAAAGAAVAGASVCRRRQHR